MSQIRKAAVLGSLLLMGALLIVSCGTSNSKSPFDADSGAHPAGWLPKGHADAAKADGSSTCMECHGSDLSGGISGVSCLSCHVNGSPFTLTDCTSCHGNPPDGTVAPNRAGAHNTITGHFAAHVIFPDGCNTCHNGAGSGTLKHDNGVVDIALLSLYSSNNGTAVHNSDGTCSNVSCHGGQTTPNWLTGKINLSTQCTSCHAFGDSEYNSFFSGQHDFHVNTLAKPCVVCHNTTTLSQNHFTTLNTTTMEGPASATIGGENTLVTAYTGTAGDCTNICHVTRSWF
jgi:predicted CxxxxCH...CXXCH cytochrome family protein